MNPLPAATNPSVRRFEIERVGGAEPVASDVVATEEPLEIRVGFVGSDGRRRQRSISITMRTPGHDHELAIGFLFTEGIVREPGDVLSVAPCGPPAPNGLINVVRVELGDSVAVDLDRLERHFYTSSSCGVCGKASLDAVAVQGRYDTAGAPFAIPYDALGRLPEALRARQAVFDQTGGLHASGLFDESGEILAVREDVGRHNALDKLIGSELAAGRLPLAERGIVVSGRASFELMQKAMVAGCAFGMTLVGFLKTDRCNIYSRPDRILGR